MSVKSTVVSNNYRCGKNFIKEAIKGSVDALSAGINKDVRYDPANKPVVVKEVPKAPKAPKATKTPKNPSGLKVFGYDNDFGRKITLGPPEKNDSETFVGGSKHPINITFREYGGEILTTPIEHAPVEITCAFAGGNPEAGFGWFVEPNGARLLRWRSHFDRTVLSKNRRMFVIYPSDYTPDMDELRYISEMIKTMMVYRSVSHAQKANRLPAKREPVGFANILSEYEIAEIVEGVVCAAITKVIAAAEAEELKSIIDNENDLDEVIKAIEDLDKAVEAKTNLFDYLELGNLSRATINYIGGDIYEIDISDILTSYYVHGIVLKTLHDLWSFKMLRVHVRSIYYTAAFFNLLRSRFPSLCVN